MQFVSQRSLWSFERLRCTGTSTPDTWNSITFLSLVFSCCWAWYKLGILFFVGVTLFLWKLLEYFLSSIFFQFSFFIFLPLILINCHWFFRNYFNIFFIFSFPDSYCVYAKFSFKVLNHFVILHDFWESSFVRSSRKQFCYPSLHI